MSEVPSGGNAAARSDGTSDFEDGDGDHDGEEVGGGEAGGNASDEGGKRAGSGAAPAASSKNEAPKSTPGRIALRLLLYEHAGRDALGFRPGGAPGLQLREVKVDLLLRVRRQLAEA